MNSQSKSKKGRVRAQNIYFLLFKEFYQASLSGTRWGRHWGRRQTWGWPWWRRWSGPITDQYSGHVTSFDQSQASIYLGNQPVEVGVGRPLHSHVVVAQIVNGLKIVWINNHRINETIIRLCLDSANYPPVGQTLESWQAELLISSHISAFVNVKSNIIWSRNYQASIQNQASIQTNPQV